MSVPKLPTLRDHFLKMAQSEHLLDCPSVTAREPYWNAWLEWDEDGHPARMRWRGPRPKWEPPHCDGCLSDEQREWFARLAGEVTEYIEEPLR